MLGGLEARGLSIGPGPGSRGPRPQRTVSWSLLVSRFNSTVFVTVTWTVSGGTE